MTASFGLRDIFERPFDGEDDPRIRVAQAITRAEAEAILEHRGDLILALSDPSPVEGGGELEYAQRLATVAASKFGPPPGWKPLGDMYGVLSQIDNCLTGLEAPTSPPQATNSEVERTLARRAYVMSEPHLSGHRVVIGFESREHAMAAHEAIARLGRAALDQGVGEP